MGTNYIARVHCKNACDHCEGDVIHLGKASAGWTFSFKGEPEWMPNIALSLWLDRVEKATRIEDEYGSSVTKSELLGMIMLKDVPTNKRHAIKYSDLDDCFLSDEGHSFTTCEFH